MTEERIVHSYPPESREHFTPDAYVVMVANRRCGRACLAAVEDRAQTFANLSVLMNSRQQSQSLYSLERRGDAVLLRLISYNGMNRLTRARVQALTSALEELAMQPPLRLVIAGNARFFSAGADLNEIAALSVPEAFRFAQMGQRLMSAIAEFPAPTIAAVEGYCMGGGLDLAMSCNHRIAAPHAVFGHRGAALGLITAWGGTQRLPHLIGKGRALQMFFTAEKVQAPTAQAIGLVDAMADDPVASALL